MSVTAAPSGFRHGLLLTGSGSVANLVLLSFEMIIAARLLPTAAYGSYVLLITAVQFLVMTIDFGSKLAVTHLISSGDHARQRVLVSTALIFRIVAVVGASALIMVFRDLLAIIDPSPDLAEYVGYIPLMLATASLDDLLFARLQGFHAYRPMAIVQIVRGFFRVVLTLILLIVFDAGIAALVYSWSLSFAVAVAYQFWALPVRTVWNWRLATLLEVLRFGFPLQLTNFLGLLSTRLHLVLLGALAGADSVAFFAVANRIPEALQTLSASYFRMYFPTMTAFLSTGQRKAAELLLERSLRLIGLALRWSP